MINLDWLEGKSVLVTGGTGSFGQKFIRHLLKHSKVQRLIVFSRDELKQSIMQRDIPDPERRLRFFLGDVRELPRLERAFRGVDYVVHAAALKQVPLLEYNPFEAVKTNILGTQNVISAAIDQKVKRVILVSTDKAANPANLYGATKLCAERLTIAANAYAGTQTLFGAVRYGNVVGSRGSIVQLIDEQRKAGQVTLTHPDMTRFWITLNQGVELVLFALSTMHGGEIFIPKIPSMKVTSLIKALAGDAAVKIIGIRPGEKMHELLITAEEARRAREFDDHYVILPEHNFHEAPEHANAKAVEEGFSLASHTNTLWLTPEELTELVATLHD